MQSYGGRLNDQHFQIGPLRDIQSGKLLQYFLPSLVCIAAVHKPTLFVTRDELTAMEEKEEGKDDAGYFLG